MEDPTVLEKIARSVAVQGSLAAVSATLGTPLAALLPVLTDTLAANRHRRRVEESLFQIETILKAHRHRLDALTDPQYKLLNEVVLAVLQNTEEEKVEYLRRAIAGGLERPDLTHTIAAQVSRAMRDLTTGELAFVIAHVEHTIMIGPMIAALSSEVVVIDRDSDEMVNVSGLIGLGVLVPAGSSQDDGGRYVFAKFCSTLRALIAEDA